MYVYSILTAGPGGPEGPSLPFRPGEPYKKKLFSWNEMNY